MLLSEEQMKLVSTILVLVVAGGCAVKRLSGNDMLTPLLGRGMIMKLFYLLVAASVAYIVYQMVQNKLPSLPTTYRYTEKKKDIKYKTKMLLSEEQMKLVSTILVLVVAGGCALKRLSGNDMLTPLLGRGMIMKAFYLLVAASVAYIVYQMVQNKMPSLPSQYHIVGYDPNTLGKVNMADIDAQISRANSDLQNMPTVAPVMPAVAPVMPAVAPEMPSELRERLSRTIRDTRKRGAQYI